MENNITSSLEGLNALVCGSTSGIGRAAAIELAELGANITLFGRNIEKLEALILQLSVSDLQKHNHLVGDFNHPDEIKHIISENIDIGEPLHILINNSGGPKGGPIIDADISEFNTTFQRHLVCNHILAQALVPGMKSAGYGRIINIISTSVKEPIKGLGVSNTIRGAVASWAKTLSAEITEFGITVNNILPGFTDTERLSSLIKSKAAASGNSEQEIADGMLAQVPAGRFGKPEETAKAIAFLSSPAAGYINGVSLAVDGGRLSCI